MTGDYSRLHEVECVEYSATVPVRMGVLHNALSSLRFCLHEDVYSLDRKGRIPPWQHPSIAEVHVYLGDKDVYGVAGEWNRVELRYLFPVLPVECWRGFRTAAIELSHRLDIPMVHNGLVVDGDGLDDCFRLWCNELQRVYGETPGSESLAIYIQGTYPR